MIARQRRKPQRQLGEIGGKWVFVNAIEAPLRDQSASVQFLILVRRNGRLLVRVTPPGVNQPRSPSARQASTRKAPDPIAGSHTLISRICCGPSQLARAARTPALAHGARSGSVSAAWRVVAAGAAALRLLAAEEACLAPLPDRLGEPRSSTIGRSAAITLTVSVAAAKCLADLVAQGTLRSASSLRNFARSVPFFAGQCSNIDENRRVRSFLPARIAEAPGQVASPP